VRAKDVGLIFADAATGAHSPALVSQGKIAAVIAARPQERRAMLEEAAGIAGLHVRRRDAEQKLRAAETNLARLDDILGDMDNRANALRRQARAAERYTLLSTQIRTAEARTIFARWREAAAASDAAKAEAQAAETAVAAAQEAQMAAAAHARAAIDALAQARIEAQQTRDAATEAGHQLTALKAERTAAAQRLADLSAQADRLDEVRGRKSALAHDAAEALTRLATETVTLKDRIAHTQAAAPERAARLAEAESAARGAEVELARAIAAQAGEKRNCAPPKPLWSPPAPDWSAPTATCASCRAKPPHCPPWNRYKTRARKPFAHRSKPKRIAKPTEPARFRLAGEDPQPPQ
jgi:chromosome segregation protein